MKKKVEIIVIILVLLTFNTIYSFVTRDIGIYNGNVSSSDYILTELMTDGYEINQKFICSRENLSAILIRFGTYDRENSGTLTFVITEAGSGDIKAEVSVDASVLANNEFTKIGFDVIKDSKNKEYNLKITANNIKEETGVSAYMTQTGKMSEGLTENGTELAESLVMKYECTKIFDIETFIVLVFFEIYIYLFLKILYKYLA